MKLITHYLGMTARVWRASGNRGRRLSALLRSIVWMVNMRTLRRPWLVRVFGDMRLRCYPASIIALHVIQRSEWFDAEVSRFISRYLRPGDTFVDVGANIGLYTLLGSRCVGAAGRVVSVEPSPVNGAHLRENLQMNGSPSNTTVKACALAAEPGELAFHDFDVQARALVGESERKATLRVPALTFESIDPGGLIALMKVDVEGFELEVLRGAETAIKAGRVPVILFEMNNAIRDYGHEPEDLFSHLRARGYSLARYDPEAQRVHVGGELFGEVLAYNESGRKLIAERMSAF